MKASYIRHNRTFASSFENPKRGLALQSDLNRLLTSLNPSPASPLAPTKRRRTAVVQGTELTNSRGVTVAPDGTVFVLDQSRPRSAIVQLDTRMTGNSRNYPENSGHDWGKRIELPKQITNPLELTFDPSTGRFQVLNASDHLLYEVTPKGKIAAVRHLSKLGSGKPQPFIFGPNLDQPSNLDQSNRTEPSLFTTDSVLGLEASAEVAAVSTQAQATRTRATLVRTIRSSQFVPPSSDPSGIVYINHTNTLLISDGEVDEIPALFTGKNLFDMSLTGNLQRTLTTVPNSTEPTGVAYNPASRFLYFSDDNADRILQLNPGSDGQYNTFDDAWTSFNTRAFNSFDPEDVAFSAATGDLFVLDGVNAEVYRVSTGGTLVSHFDTESLGVVDPEGITFLDNGNMVIVGQPTNRVAEITPTGTLVRMIDISAANAVKPAGIAFAPSSQNFYQRSLYIVDRGVDNSVSPNQNDGKVYEFALGITATNQPPVTSAGPDQVVALRAYLDGAVFDDGLPNPPATVTTSWSQVSGPGGTASFSNVSAQDTTVTFSTPGDYVLQLAASDSTLTGTDRVSLRVLNPQSTLFVSPSTNASVAGLAFQNEDILAFDRLTNTWLMYFDGSDVGLTNFDLKDFHINTDGTILLTLNTPATLPGLGDVDDSDVVKFTPTATGDTTAGTFELYFDGSDVDLTTDSEALDALTIAPDGRLIFSTKGTATVAGNTIADEDLLAFTPTGLGVNTAGTWSLYFDGSDVDLNDSDEDIDGVWIDGTGRLYLTTEGAFSVPGLSGTGSDIFRFTPTSLGANTAGSYTSFWNAAAAGLSGSVIDGVTQIG